MKSFDPSSLLLIPLFPIGFAALWIFVCALISLMGWRTLATHFRVESKPTGQSFPMQGAEIGGAQYNGCLSAVVADSGLYLRPWIPFRFFHAPILIPWRAFSPVTTKKVLWVQVFATQVQTPDRKKVDIKFSGSLGTEVQKRVEMAHQNAPSVELHSTPWSN